MYGSLQNKMMAQVDQTQPEVGMAATILFYTDRRAATVVSVSKSKIEVQEDDSVRVDANGMSDCQTYEFSRNLNGRIRVFTRRRNGQWVLRGSSARSAGVGLLLGARKTYHDFSF